jgi:hypothetical protein
MWVWIPVLGQLMPGDGFSIKKKTLLLQHKGICLLVQFVLTE